MKLTSFTILALCIIAVCESVEEEYDYEEEVAAPVTPAPIKPVGGRLGGLLSSRGRINVSNVGKKRTSSSHSSTTPKPIEQAPDEYEEGEGAYDENQEHEAATTTTEATKKLRSGGVRPFRSNEDLLAALKRRRAQTGPSNHPRESAVTPAAAAAAAVDHTTAKSKAAASSRGKISAGGEARTSRGKYGGRGSKLVPEEVEETQRDEIQVKPKTSSYRRG